MVLRTPKFFDIFCMKNVKKELKESKMRPKNVYFVLAPKCRSRAEIPARSYNVVALLANILKLFYYNYAYAFIFLIGTIVL